MKEKQVLENIGPWYDSKEGFKKDWRNFHKRLVYYRYLTVKPFFQGRICLTLGIADGEMTQYLLNDFKKIVGVDGAKHFIEEVNNRFSADIHTGKLELVHSLFEDYQPDCHFATVLMGHILEHLEQPKELLHKAKTWLSQNGIIIILVPNANSIHRQAGVKMGLLRKCGELNELDKKLGHRRVYSSKTLIKDIESAGLKIKELGGIFLKPLTNKQIEDTWTEEMMDAFYELGKEYPEIAAEVYAVCEK